MDKSDITREWIEIADLDFASANYLLGMQPIPVEIICYHCQQAAEKYLKGFLASIGHEIIRTHDLVLLNKLCREVDGNFKAIEEECLLLTDYSVTIRYPYPLELNRSDATLALENAEAIQKFVLQKINE